MATWRTVYYSAKSCLLFWSTYSGPISFLEDLLITMEVYKSVPYPPPFNI